jgi:hypothetical protein
MKAFFGLEGLINGGVHYGMTCADAQFNARLSGHAELTNALPDVYSLNDVH